MRAAIFLIATGCVSYGPQATYDTATMVHVAPSAHSIYKDVVDVVDWLNDNIGADVFSVTMATSEKMVPDDAVLRVVDFGCDHEVEPCLTGSASRKRSGVTISVRAMAPKVIIAHEIGHAAGLEHSSDSSNFMYWINPILLMNESQRIYLAHISGGESEKETH